MYPKGTNEENWIEAVKDATVVEDALQPSVTPPWKTPKAFWYAGKVTRLQTGAQDEGNAERWKRSRSWNGD